MTSRTMSTIDIVDLFAGCGGLTKGFHDFRPVSGDTSPFRSVGAVESDIAAATTYAANFGAEHTHACRIEDWSPDSGASDVDVILGGPPCQGFSGLGKGDPDDPRNTLWRQYVKVVEALRPKIFIIENVDRFLRSPQFALLRQSAEPGGELGDYMLKHLVLNAADYGVPQARRRVIVLATHRDLVSSHPDRVPLTHPEPTHRRVTGAEGQEEVELDDGLHRWVSASVVFDHTPGETVTTQLPEGRDIELLSKSMPGAFRTRELHIGRQPTDKSIARYKAIPPGGNRHDLAKHPHLTTKSWLRHQSGSGDVMGRMFPDRPSVTIRTEFFKPEKGRYLHPTAHRPITHMEAALLQGFPEDYLWCGSKTEIARQIGNAVPVGLGKALAGAVYGYLAAI
jgi:DNA (cytosine-5)-methyltransferase 1